MGGFELEDVRAHLLLGEPRGIDALPHAEPTDVAQILRPRGMRQRAQLKQVQASPRNGPAIDDWFGHLVNYQFYC